MGRSTSLPSVPRCHQRVGGRNQSAIIRKAVSAGRTLAEKLVAKSFFDPSSARGKLGRGRKSIENFHAEIRAFESGCRRLTGLPGGSAEETE